MKRLRGQILVLAVSTEEEPWKSIETKGQWPSMSTLEKKYGMDVVWYRGSPRELAPHLGRVLTARQNILTKVAYFSDGLSRLVNIRNPFYRFVSSNYRDSFGFSRAHEKLSGFDGNYIFRGKVLRVSTSDNYIFMATRTLAAFQWALENSEFEFLVRTNSTTFIHGENLLRYLQSVEGAVHYSGKIQTYFGLDYASGSGVILSRAAVNAIVDSVNLWRHDLHEDVALGVVLNRLGFQVSSQVDAHPSSSEAAAKFDFSAAGNSIFVRCKHADPKESIQMHRELANKQ